MPGGGEQRTEKATPERLRKARERGDVARSRDLSAVLVIAGAAAWLAQGWTALWRTALAEFQRAFARAGAVQELTFTDLQLLAAAGAALLRLLAPFLGVVAVAAALGMFVQVGPLLAGAALRPRLDRLDPVQGLRNRFGDGAAPLEALRGLLKLTLLGGIAGFALADALPGLVRLTPQPPGSSLRFAADLLGRIASWTVAFGAAVAGADVFYQRWRYARKQRMSRREIREEYKTREGDPRHKQERQRQHRELALNAALQDVRTRGAVAVRNPTHLVVVLAYEPDERELPPQIVAKGADWLAAEILKIVAAERLPVVRNVSVARALYSLEVDDYVPRELYEAMFDILNWAEALAESAGRTVRWRRERRDEL